MSKPRLLDLFSGAGGAAVGYARAGFEVVGVDINDQPHYPFEFHKADALEYCREHGREFDAIHASPPCQAYSCATHMRANSPHRKVHPRLVEPTRAAMLASRAPYIIENVPGAPLRDPLMLCGTMFPALRVYRHRLFELHGFSADPPSDCNHTHRMGKRRGEYHTLDKSPYITCAGHNFQARSGRIAMGIPWMTRDELAQAIPPAYTEYIGRQLIEVLTG